MPGSLAGVLGNPYVVWLIAQTKAMAAMLADIAGNKPAPARDVLVYTVAIVVIALGLLRLTESDTKKNARAAEKKIRKGASA